MQCAWPGWCAKFQSPTVMSSECSAWTQAGRPKLMAAVGGTVEGGGAPNHKREARSCTAWEALLLVAKELVVLPARSTRKWTTFHILVNNIIRSPSIQLLHRSIDLSAFLIWCFNLNYVYSVITYNMLLSSGGKIPCCTFFGPNELSKKQTRIFLIRI